MFLVLSLLACDNSFHYNDNADSGDTGVLDTGEDRCSDDRVDVLAHDTDRAYQIATRWMMRGPLYHTTPECLYLPDLNVFGARSGQNRVDLLQIALSTPDGAWAAELGGRLQLSEVSVGDIGSFEAADGDPDSSFVGTSWLIDLSEHDFWVGVGSELRFSLEVEALADPASIGQFSDAEYDTLYVAAQASSWKGTNSYGGFAVETMIVDPSE